MLSFRWRYLIPFALIAFCLVSLCVLTGISLFRQQSALAQILHENLRSRRAAIELEECLIDLIALKNDQAETLSALHQRLRLLILRLKEVANEEKEQQLYASVSQEFDSYLNKWKAIASSDASRQEQLRKEARAYLESKILMPCRAFEQFNIERIETSAENRERVLMQLTWGMVVIGLLGGVAGLVLGFGLTRSLSQSINRLHVQIRDAAGKLKPDQTEIVFTKDGDFAGLHAEIERLTAHIETTVRNLQQREYEVARAKQLAAVGQLAAGVGHEIRNPLTSIKMLVQTGLEDQEQALVAEDLKVIEGEIRRMEHSLQRFLDFSRPVKAERKETDLSAIISSVVDLIKGRASRQHVQIEQRYPVHEPMWLVIDGEQIRQVLVNICMNALDAMPTGGTLSIDAKRLPNGSTCMELIDTGPGISGDILPRLFEPFASSKTTGLGLGLVISKRIIEEHLGTLSIEKASPHGTRVVISLPGTVQSN